MSFLQDIHQALRSLRNHFRFAALAICTLALGIGAATTLFSVLNAVVLKPLPFTEPDALFLVQGLRADGRSSAVSVPDFVDWREQQEGLIDLAALSSTGTALTTDEGALAITAARVTAEFLPLLGVNPLYGRLFTVQETREQVVLLSHSFWKTHYLEDRGVVGEQIRVAGHEHTVLGILPPGLGFPEDEIDLWLPLVFTEDEAEDRGRRFLEVVARLAPGVSQEQAAGALNAVVERLATQYPETNDGRGVDLVPLQDAVMAEHRQGLVLLLGAAFLVLLIACANVANLMLVRTTQRERELVVRTALGASRAQLIAQLFTESLLLGLLGCGGGILLATWGVQLAVGLSPAGLPRASLIAVDFQVLLFALALALATSFLFGLLPALVGSRQDLQSGLRQAGSISSPGGSARKLLIVGELALAMILLLGTGLLLRSFAKVLDIDPGFHTQGLLTARLSLQPAHYSSEEEGAFVRELHRRAGELQGVETAALLAPLPLSGNIFRLGLKPDGAEGKETFGGWQTTTPGYFEAMGIRLLAGRFFDQHDTEHPVVIVDESLAERLWPGQSALGRMLEIGYNELQCEVVGVVGDVRPKDPLTASPGAVYTPIAITPWGPLDIVLKTSGDPLALAGSLRALVRQLNPELPLTHVRTMDELYSRSLAGRRFILVLLALFATLALLLAAVGIYGVTSYAVAQGQRELGVHVSLGATPWNVLWAVLRPGLRLLAAGAALGVLGGFFLGRLFADQLYHVEVHDPAALAAAALGLSGLALAAMLGPARRAARMDPASVLRAE